MIVDYVDGPMAGGIRYLPDAAGDGLISYECQPVDESPGLIERSWYRVAVDGRATHIRTVVS